MKLLSLNKVFAFAVILLVFASCNKQETQETLLNKPAVEPHSEANNVVPGQYIITFKEEVMKPALTLNKRVFSDRLEKAASIEKTSEIIKKDIQDFLRAQKIDLNKVSTYYTITQVGFVAKLTAEEFTALTQHTSLKAIEYDHLISIPDYKLEASSHDNSRFQITPCGITRAGGAGTATSGKWIWIIDSGIDTDHPDLNVLSNAPFAKSFIGGTVEDCNGHGTHVAGTAAARNNSIGVVGMAPGARVVPVRVFKCSGSTPTSTIVSAVEHVAKYNIAGDVVNMSLGGYFGPFFCSFFSSYKGALETLGNEGTRVALAAGNESSNAGNYQPACINATNVYTIASMTCSRSWSSFSNYGRGPIDYIAKGSSVYSTYLNGGYATLSGTSMAAPHVAGIMNVRQAAPRTSGVVVKSGTSYPIAVR